MDNKVGNPKIDPMPSTNTFNDEDILNDLQTSLKHLSTMYGTLNQEASHKELVDKIETLSKEVSRLARDSFNLMFENGWYCLEKQEEQKLNEEYNKFSQKLGEISL